MTRPNFQVSVYTLNKSNITFKGENHYHYYHFTRKILISNDLASLFVVCVINCIINYEVQQLKNLSNSAPLLNYSWLTS